MGITADIDIDFPDRNAALNYIKYIPASMIKNKVKVSHLSGVYFQDIPMNPIDGMAIYDYIEASEKGYFKVDFLTNYIYKDIRNEHELDRLFNTEPIWELFEEPEILKYINQLKDHEDVTQFIKPRCLEDLAICLALIRPAKKYLFGKDRQEIEKEIWEPNKDGSYQFKKSHAYAYAGSLIIQMNLLCEKIKNGTLTK